MNMITDTSTIKSAVVETYRETLSAEEHIDQFLDHLNEAKVHYHDLNKYWENLNEKTESFISKFSSIDDFTFILSSIEGLISRAESLLSKIKINQQHYIGIKSQIDLLEENIDFSRELCEDIKLKIDPQIIELGTQLDNL